MLNDLLGGCTVRVDRVDQRQEGLANGLQFLNDTAFDRGIAFAGKIGERAVGRDDKTDGGVIFDDFFGADLSGFSHRHGRVTPGG